MKQNTLYPPRKQAYKKKPSSMKKLPFTLLLLALSSAVHAELKIFTLQHHLASDLISTIAPLVGQDGAVTGMSNQLIVRATPEQMREIETIVNQLDTERVNRKITVSTNQLSNTETQRIEANGNLKKGSVSIGNDHYSLPNTVNIDLENNQRRSHQNAQQFINVLDGERAFIRVGTIVPYTQDWIVMTQHYVQVANTTSWQEISTGFAVRPRTIGDEVELEITPRIAKQNTNQFIDFEELTTVVRVHLGEWVDIGGTMQNRDDVSRKILGYAAMQSSKNTSLNIKVE
jgi:type II secretory pathway component GspD/PulD (secretin)